MTSTHLFETPGQNRYFEDYIEGMEITFGAITVDEDEVLEFAKRFDPQAIHTNPEKAKDGPYGGLIASGWHTASMMMKLITQYYLSDVSSLGSPGLDNIRWPAPVRPGDTLSVHLKITKTRRSQSKPDRGIVLTFFEVINQDGVVVLDMNSTNFVVCRSEN